MKDKLLLASDDLNVAPGKFRNLTLYYYLALLLVYVVVFVGLSFRGESLLPGTPFIEDGFYALSVSRNLAIGKGISVDGITPTNGFQPLYVFLASSMYWITGGERLSTLRLVILFHSAIMLLAALLAGLVVSRLGSAIAAKPTPARAMLFGMLLYLSHLPLIYHHFNGLETGLVLLFYIAILHFLLRMNHKKTLSWLVLGLLCGFLVLARIDSAVFVALFSFKILLSRPSLSFRQRLRQFLLVSATAALVSAPWWLYNYFCFGSLMPSSGTAQQDLAISAARLRPMAAHIANLGMPWLWLQFPGQTIIKLLLLGGMVAASTIILARRAMDRHRATTNEVMYRLAEFAVPFIIYLVFLAIYYSFTFWVTYFYGRYLAPVAVISVLSLALLLLVGSDRVFWIKPALITAVTLPAFAVIGSWHRPNYLDAQLISQDQSSKYYVNQYQLIAETVSPTEIVSASQTGTLGYFRDGVMNLDGKVNAEALRRRKDLPVYLREKDVRYFCDWEMFTAGYLGKDPAEKGWRQIARKGSGEFAFVLWERTE